MPGKHDLVDTSIDPYIVLYALFTDYNCPLESNKCQSVFKFNELFKNLKKGRVWLNEAL